MALRFNTDRALFETFPTARNHVGADPSDIAPTILARNLVADRKISEAVSLCAYMLSRREAVAWGCRTLRLSAGHDSGWTTPSLQAAELWVKETTELRQAAARDVGARSDDIDPTTWMARAAGWAGGSMGPQIPFPAPPHLTAVGVRIGLMLALGKAQPSEKLERGRACVEDAIRTAEGVGRP